MRIEEDVALQRIGRGIWHGLYEHRREPGMGRTCSPKPYSAMPVFELRRASVLFGFASTAGPTVGLNFAATKEAASLVAAGSSSELAPHPMRMGIARSGIENVFLAQCFQRNSGHHFGRPND